MHIVPFAKKLPHWYPNGLHHRSWHCQLKLFLSRSEALAQPQLHGIHVWGGRKGMRWCSFALYLVRFCGNFYFNSRYCGFKTLSGLRLLQPLSRGFRWIKKVSAVITLFRTVGIRLFCKRKPSVLFYNASGFIISAYNLTLWFAITAFSS